jgi:hypothetical protein
MRRRAQETAVAVMGGGPARYSSYPLLRSGAVGSIVLIAVATAHGGWRSSAEFGHPAVRLQLHALAYNLGNFMRTLAMPEAEPWLSSR